MSKGLRNALMPWMFLLPAFTFIGIIVVFPILYTIYISLTNMNIFNWADFRIIGFANYQRALNVFSSGFFRALLVTILWTFFNMLFQLSIAFVMASLLNVKKLRYRRIYKTLLMFPWAMPGYISILLWKHGIFNAQFGLLNQWLISLGIEPQRWLVNDVTAFSMSMIVNLWLALPFMIMIIDGALQSLDKSYYESALLDGAGWYKRSVSLTIPAIRPIIAPAVIITLFTTFRQFDVIYLMTKQVGSRTGANIHTVLTYAHENAFVTHNYGYSSAVSVIIFVMLIVFSSLMFFRKQKPVQ